MICALRSARFYGTHFHCILMNWRTHIQIEHQRLKRLGRANLPCGSSSTNSPQRQLLLSAEVQKGCSSGWTLITNPCVIPPAGAGPNLLDSCNKLLVASSGRTVVGARVCSIVARSGIAMPNLQGSYVNPAKTAIRVSQFGHCFVTRALCAPSHTSAKTCAKLAPDWKRRSVCLSQSRGLRRRSAQSSLKTQISEISHFRGQKKRANRAKTVSPYFRIL